jgi:hypothetical protein
LDEATDEAIFGKGVVETASVNRSAALYGVDATKHSNA